MIAKLKRILERAADWPEEDQAELAKYAEEIVAARDGAEYVATADELAAIAESEHSGIATEAEIKAAFRAFRRG